MPPGCTAASAISGLPITSVAVRSGSLTTLARAMATTTVPFSGVAATSSAAWAFGRPGRAQARMADARTTTRPGRWPRRQAFAVILRSARFYSLAANHHTPRRTPHPTNLNAKWGMKSESDVPLLGAAHHRPALRVDPLRRIYLNFYGVLDASRKSSESDDHVG